jgi:hypothetical protein
MANMCQFYSWYQGIQFKDVLKTSKFYKSCFLYPLNEIALCGRVNRHESDGKKCASAVRIDPALWRSGGECLSHYTIRRTRGQPPKTLSITLQLLDGAAKRRNFTHVARFGGLSRLHFSMLGPQKISNVIVRKQYWEQIFIESENCWFNWCSPWLRSLTAMTPHWNNQLEFWHCTTGNDEQTKIGNSELPTQWLMLRV